MRHCFHGVQQGCRGLRDRSNWRVHEDGNLFASGGCCARVRVWSHWFKVQQSTSRGTQKPYTKTFLHTPRFNSTRTHLQGSPLAYTNMVDHGRPLTMDIDHLDHSKSERKMCNEENGAVKEPPAAVSHFNFTLSFSLFFWNTPH